MGSRREEKTEERGGGSGTREGGGGGDGDAAGARHTAAKRDARVGRAWTESPCPRSTVSDKAVTFQLRKCNLKTCHPRRKVVHDSNSTIDTACCFNRTTQVGVGRVSLARGKTAGQGRPAPRALS